METKHKAEVQKLKDER
jgi:hypothetical protein